MPDINSNIAYIKQPHNVDNTPVNLNYGDDKVLDAHYTNNMKIKRPKINPDSISITIPPKASLYSDSEATKKFQHLNTDIYEGQRKEKSNHEFNFSTFFKIFVGFITTAAVIACIRKIIHCFGKK